MEIAKNFCQRNTASIPVKWCKIGKDSRLIWNILKNCFSDVMHLQPLSSTQKYTKTSWSGLVISKSIISKYIIHNS